jgi:hypothetical protein
MVSRGQLSPLHAALAAHRALFRAHEELLPPRDYAALADIVVRTAAHEARRSSRWLNPGRKAA